MYYKQYGDTNMKVSAIGMGCMRYDEEDVKAGRLEKCAEIPLYALEKGINYFDTAPFYCEDQSETITGLALSQVSRDQYYLSSKANIGTTGKVVSEEAFRRRLEKTLTRLKVDYLDFYHLWCLMSLQDFKRQSDALYGFFEKAKAEGLIRNIVFSSHMPGPDLEKVIATDRFKGMLIGYNALNYRFRQSGIAAAAAKGMGVVVMNPLGGGVIPSHPDKFGYLAEGTDLTVAQAALRFVASHQEITIALGGFTTREHVNDACRAVENLVEQPAKVIAAAMADKGLALNDLCTGCGYCDSCPVGIEIPKYMDAYNQQLLGGSIEERLQWHWDIPAANAATCTRCGKCEKLCTQHLPIIKRLAEIAELAQG
jgi:predicted aldo/keto reductase-like oxidoreductase